MPNNKTKPRPDFVPLSVIAKSTSKPYVLRRRMHTLPENRAKKLKSDQLFVNTVRSMLENKKLLSSRGFIQHGDVSVLAHSLAVAAYSVKLADAMGLKCDKRSLIRGALLHDYFLYDWHKTNNVGDGLHGFAHPDTASKNAMRDYILNKRELDIIRKHMWPLTLTKLPRYRESWLVCAVDKYCSLLETLGMSKYGYETFVDEEMKELLRELEKTQKQ